MKHNTWLLRTVLCGTTLALPSLAPAAPPKPPAAPAPAAAPTPIAAIPVPAGAEAGAQFKDRVAVGQAARGLQAALQVVGGDVERIGQHALHQVDLPVCQRLGHLSALDPARVAATTEAKLALDAADLGVECGGGRRGVDGVVQLSAHRDSMVPKAGAGAQ